MALSVTQSSDNSTSRSAADIKQYLIVELSKALQIEPRKIDSSAPLETLGVDSLMALGMAGGLAAWLDRDVPATLMWDYRSIDAIAEGMASPIEAEKPLPEGIVKLQPHGDGPAIFGFPGLAGTPMAFMSLANKLGPNQPFYGVAVPGFDRKSKPLTSVEEITAKMLKAIRQVQPKGPYLLAGYCFGGLLVFEAAQQLIAAGEEVSLLAIYDAFTRAGRVFRPRWERFALHAYLLATGKTSVKDVIGKLNWSHFRRKRVGPQIEHWAELAPGDNDPAKILWNASSQAAATYLARPYPGSVLWFGATERQPYTRFYRLMPCGGWSKLAAGGVTVVSIPGNHGNLIDTEHAVTAANALRPYLQSPTPRQGQWRAA